MRQNGHGALTFEDARTWIEETGLCLFLPRRQFSSSIAPSFVEAIAGKRDATPDPHHIAAAEELLVRLELDGVAVRLNLLGQPGEQPDFVVAAWVLPYVYALRGDRDWRRSPQLTGSRQVSQLAVQTYKLLEQGDTTITKLTQALGREVTEVAVLRAITELWQQLRIIPTISAVGEPAQWQLLRHRFQKAIAEGASTSQVTAISVLASIYLQAVIAASMEEVELFLAPLTARSKVREVLRGLVATRQVHTISLGHSPHFYVAGTLPEFAAPPTLFTSSSIAASAYFMHARELEDDLPEYEAPKPVASIPASAPTRVEQRTSPESHAPRTPAVHKPASDSKSASARPHFSRPAVHSRDRKPAQSSSGSRPGARPARRSSADSSARPAASNGTRPSSAKWTPKAPATANGKQHNGAHNNGAHANGSRANGAHSNGAHSTGSGNGARSNGNASRPANGATGARTTKSSAPAWSQRNGHANGTKSASKPSTTARSGSGARKDARPEARPSRSTRKPALTAGTRAGNSKRFGFTARPKTKQETKKRG
jgi:23S rRNA pseudouridine2605 synthase